MRVTVTLDKGEAYFEIKHDAAHPFVVVWPADHRIVDLGTKFLVRDEANGREVALVEGRASCDWRNVDTCIAALLNAGRRRRLPTGDTMFRDAQTSQQFGRILAGGSGVLVFDNTHACRRGRGIQSLQSRAKSLSRTMSMRAADDQRHVSRTTTSMRSPPCADMFGSAASTHRGDEIVISR